MAARKQTFTPEFRAEAVRLAQTSGRSRREVAADLDVGLSTLRNWIDDRREQEMDHPPAERQEDMAAELKRLRRENEVLRQEREILKRATAFFGPSREIDEVPPHRRGEEGLPGRAPVQSSRRQSERLFCLEGPSGLGAAARGSRAARSRSLRLHALARDLRQPPHDARVT
jgi:transposase